MTSWMDRWLFAATAVVSLSGLGYLWMKYFLSTDDPFSLVNHPLEPWMLDLHVISAPLLIALLGMAFALHVLPKLRLPGPARRSGLISLASGAVACASGYLLQVTTAPGWTRVWVLTHVATGVAFAVSYLGHRIASNRVAHHRVERGPCRSRAA